MLTPYFGGLSARFVAGAAFLAAGAGAAFFAGVLLAADGTAAARAPTRESMVNVTVALPFAPRDLITSASALPSLRLPACPQRRPAPAWLVQRA